MKIKKLMAMLAERNPEAKVRVRLDGSIYPTDNVVEHRDYNNMCTDEFFILALEDFEEDDV